MGKVSAMKGEIIAYGVYDLTVRELFINEITSIFGSGAEFLKKDNGNTLSVKIDCDSIKFYNYETQLARFVKNSYDAGIDISGSFLRQSDEEVGIIEKYVIYKGNLNKSKGETLYRDFEQVPLK